MGRAHSQNWQEGKAPLGRSWTQDGRQGATGMTGRLEAYSDVGKAGKLTSGKSVTPTGNLPLEVVLKVQGKLSTGVPPQSDRGSSSRCP